MKTIVIVALLLTMAFCLGQCAGHYANSRVAENNPFEKRLEVQQ